jgi:hypothetical protein
MPPGVKCVRASGHRPRLQSGECSIVHLSPTLSTPFNCTRCDFPVSHTDGLFVYNGQAALRLTGNLSCGNFIEWQIC